MTASPLIPAEQLRLSVAPMIPMIEAALARFALKRVVLVADRGLLSLDNLAAIEALRTPAALPIEYILAVPGRRYGEFAELVRNTQINDGIGDTTWQSRRHSKNWRRRASGGFTAA